MPKPLTWTKNRGQNGWDALVDVPVDQSVTSRNVHLLDGGLGTRRSGSVALSVTAVASITAPYNALFEFYPGQDDTVSKLIIVDNSGTIKILDADVGAFTLTDNVATAPTMVDGVVFNGKLYLAYDSTVNRLHVQDPGLSTTTIRRAGMGTPAAATVANGGGAGAYPTTLRYYRIAFTEQRGGVTVRRSLLGNDVSFTPGGANANATVTKPASLSEGETHWEVYGSADDILYFALAADVVGALSAAIVVGTTTYADTTLPGDYANYTAAPLEGANTPFPSVKSIGTDGLRLYGLGVWETTAGDSVAPKSGRFYFGPVLDSSSVHDDERINNTTLGPGYIDLARNSSGIDRGVSKKPVNNAIYAFQSKGVYALFPTGSATTPFRRVAVDPEIGSVHHKAIVVATDRNGATCCYFADPLKGPYVVGGSQGLKWCGKDIADVWATVNLDATTIAAWGVSDAANHQVIFGVATAGANSPNLLLVLHVMEQSEDADGDLRGGWTIYDGDFAAAMCAVMFSYTLGATRSRFKVLHAGGSKLLRADAAVNRDDTTSFQSTVTSGSLIKGVQDVQVDRAYVVADAAFGVSIRHRLIRNAGAENRDSTLVLTVGEAGETIVLRKAEDAALQGAWTVQVSIGDAAAANVNWHLHGWSGVVSGESYK